MELQLLYLNFLDLKESNQKAINDVKVLDRIVRHISVTNNRDLKSRLPMNIMDFRYYLERRIKLPMQEDEDWASFCQQYILNLPNE